MSIFVASATRESMLWRPPGPRLETMKMLDSQTSWAQLEGANFLSSRRWGLWNFRDQATNEQINQIMPIWILETMWALVSLLWAIGVPTKALNRSSSHMLHVCYIYLHDWVIYVGQMLVNIPAPWSIWACEPQKKQTTICCCGRSSTEPRFGHAWPTGNTAATVKSGNSCGKAQLGTYETSKCAETGRKERRKEKLSCYWCTFYLLGGTRVGFYMFLQHS